MGSQIFGLCNFGCIPPSGVGAADGDGWNGHAAFGRMQYAAGACGLDFQTANASLLAYLCLAGDPAASGHESAFLPDASTPIAPLAVFADVDNDGVPQNGWALGYSQAGEIWFCIFTAGACYYVKAGLSGAADARAGELFGKFVRVEVRKAGTAIRLRLRTLGVSGDGADDETLIEVASGTGTPAHPGAVTSRVLRIGEYVNGAGAQLAITPALVGLWIYNNASAAQNVLTGEDPATGAHGAAYLVGRAYAAVDDYAPVGSLAGVTAADPLFAGSTCTWYADPGAPVQCLPFTVADLWTGRAAAGFGWEHQDLLASAPYPEDLAAFLAGVGYGGSGPQLARLITPTPTYGCFGNLNRVLSPAAPQTYTRDAWGAARRWRMPALASSGKHVFAAFNTDASAPAGFKLARIDAGAAKGQTALVVSAAQTPAVTLNGHALGKYQVRGLGALRRNSGGAGSAALERVVAFLAGWKSDLSKCDGVVAFSSADLTAAGSAETFTEGGALNTWTLLGGVLADSDADGYIPSCGIVGRHVACCVLHPRDGRGPLIVAYTDPLSPTSLKAVCEEGADVDLTAAGTALAAVAGGCKVPVPAGYTWMWPLRAALRADEGMLVISVLAGTEGTGPAFGEQGGLASGAVVHLQLVAQFDRDATGRDKLVLHGDVPSIYPFPLAAENLQGVEVWWETLNTLILLVPRGGGGAAARAGALGRYAAYYDVYRGYDQCNGALRKLGTWSPVSGARRSAAFAATGGLEAGTSAWSGTAVSSDGTGVLTLTGGGSIATVDGAGGYLIELAGRTDGIGGTALWRIAARTTSPKTVTVQAASGVLPPAGNLNTTWTIWKVHRDEQGLGDGQLVAGVRHVPGTAHLVAVQLADQRVAGVPPEFHLGRLALVDLTDLVSGQRRFDFAALDGEAG